MLAALAGVAAPAASFADGSPLPESAAGWAARLVQDDHAVLSARAALAATPAVPDPGAPALLRVQADLRRMQAGYAYRQAIRDQQADVLRLAAGDGSDPVLKLLPGDLADPVSGAVDAERALWRLGGVTEAGRTRLRRRPVETTPAAALRSYFAEAEARSGVGWTYLAAINYIESDFGRAAVTSSAGAVGPMQFLPSTWAAYGAGDIQNPHDAILGAANYLARSGAPRDMPGAIWRYNHDGDYVDAVTGFATALAADPTWFDRLYYWGTAG